MPTGVALMITSKRNLAEIGALDGMRFGLAREFLRLDGSAIQNPHFGSAFLETEDRGAGRASGAESLELLRSRWRAAAQADE